MFRGLFIGIDRYAAPITRLSCARADAVALGCLFEDAGGAEVTFLLDADATADGIRTALERIKSDAADDDLVMVTFSGHGTEDHQLVPVDAGPDLDNCVGLGELAKHLDEIAASQLIVVLDCCFSGGFGGARVFAPASARSPVEDRGTLVELARGDGRVVLAASGAGEPALETMRFGHGLFSHHLLEALQGFGQFETAERIPLYDLLGHVTTAVVDSARLLGCVQTPSLYGSIDGAPTLPRLSPGPSYARAFPQRVRPPATSEWGSLVPYGIGVDVLDRWKSAMPAGLNELQLHAINEHGLLEGKSLVVVAPTSSGKTMIGELAAVREAGLGGRAVVLLPLRALVNDKYAYLTDLYGDHLEVVRATGEHSDQVGSIYQGQYDVALLTYEKFLNIVTADPWVLRGISLVVVDEAQNISDSTRGANLELLLTLLRSGHARGGAPQIVALSAVIGGTNGLERWLDASLLRTDTRPVPLRESMIDGTGTATHLMPDGSIAEDPDFVIPDRWVGGQGSKQLVVPLVRRLVGEGKKVIVFRSTKGEAIGTATYLAAALGLPPARSALDALPDRDLSTSSATLRAALNGGVGVHNADLAAEERSIIETLFRDPKSDIAVVVATTTLAMGVNTPAEAVVIAGLTHPAGSGDYSVAEYKNMVGRAGRLGITEAGESYVVATGQPRPSAAWNRYITGDPERVMSHFLDATTDPQTLILRCLVAMHGSVRADELIDLLENSFAVWQRMDAGGNGWDRSALGRDLDALLDADLLDREPDGALTVTELGRFAGESGLEVRSVTRVSSFLRFAPAILSVADLVATAQVTVELDGVHLPVAGRARAEQARWPMTLHRAGVAGSLVQRLHVGGGVVVARQKKAAAALLFASAMPMDAIEREITRHLPGRAASGPVRAVAGRTRDVLDAVIGICRVRGFGVQDERAVDLLAVRLEIGLPDAIAELAGVVGRNLTRGEYLDLLAAGVVSPDGVMELPEDRLAEILPSATARALRRLLHERDVVVGDA
ncbi:DEAD/DEAH box helicase [Pseudonocardia sp.]|uniref:DEAD/DEAH box helicase n=1 Tax=Pseudonocardia sp. TaxID=60912 RepID=UPI002606A21E|nr:DEAD/DEAH box helicase [Pseudonocardia sp.]